MSGTMGAQSKARFVGIRLRAALALLALVLPVALGAAWVTRAVQTRSAIAGVAHGLRERLEDEREVCERDPATWPPGHSAMMERGGDPGRRAEGRAERWARRARHRHFRRASVFAYDESFTSANPRAPRLDPELRGRLSAGAEEAARLVHDAGHPQVLLAVRMADSDGPCGIMTARLPAPPGVFTSLRAPAIAFGAVSVAAALIAFVVFGPLVRRLEALTQAVRDEGSATDAVRARGRDEVSVLAEALDTQRAHISAQVQALTDREQALRDYITQTSHDVMMPVTVLQGHLSRMREAAHGGAKVEVEEVVAAMEEASYLTSLMENLSAMARLDGTASHRAPLDLGAVVSRVVMRHRVVAEAKGVALEFAVPEAKVTVDLDSTLVERMLGNLVQNAIRYGRDDGHVAVVLDLIDGGRAFSLRVVDDGPGMSDADLLRAFERGHRGGEARTRHPHGMGLGLAIAKEVAEHHGFALSLHKGAECGLEVEVSGRTV